MFLLLSSSPSCRSSPSPSPISQLASSQSAGVPLHTESQDSERMISEATLGEMGPPDDQATAESPTPEVTMVVAVDPAMEVAGASTAAA
jgi:hypothetical protein